MDLRTHLILLFSWMWSLASPYSIEKHILDSAKTAEMFDLFHVMPDGVMKVVQELDMLLSIDQYKMLYMDDANDEPSSDEGISRDPATSSRRRNGRKRKRKPKNRRVKRKAARAISVRWPKCVVYYEITESLGTRPDRRVIQDAIDEWEKYTCLVFVETDRVSRRIQFTDGDMCASAVGMQNEPQPLQLASGCRTKGIIAHEIGHAIGWFHEHMRPDRDDYLNVHFSRIPSKYRSNYRKYNTDVVNTYDIPYDYTSIMHYGDTAFPGSIEARDPRFQSKLGQRNGFSFKDIKMANVMYECAKAMKCPHMDCGEGFQLYKPFKNKPACKCWCDSGNVSDPLVLCSERKTRPIEPAVVTLPPPTSQPSMECMDVREDCKDMKEKGHCMSKMALMMANCAKTCEFCDKGKDLCMDYEVGCGVMAGHCKVPGLRAAMNEICMATCDMCGKPPPDPCAIQKEMMGDMLPSKGASALKLTSHYDFLRVLILCPSVVFLISSVVLVGYN